MRTISILAAAFLLSLAPRLNATPRLVVSAVTLTPAPIRPGSNGPTQSIEAQNAGDGTLNLTASSSASWLSATVGAPQKCVILSGTCDPVSITLATASLAAGTYTEFITLADPNAIDSTQQIAVNVTIAAVPSSLTFYVGPAGSANEGAVAYIYPASAVTGTVSTTSGGIIGARTPLPPKQCSGRAARRARCRRVRAHPSGVGAQGRDPDNPHVSAHRRRDRGPVHGPAGPVAGYCQSQLVNAHRFCAPRSPMV